jgi:hypothetical protein
MESAQVAAEVLELAARACRGQRSRLYLAIIERNRGLALETFADPERGHERLSRITQCEILYRSLIQDEGFGPATAEVCRRAAYTVSDLEVSQT